MGMQTPRAHDQADCSRLLGWAGSVLGLEVRQLEQVRPVSEL